MGTGYVLSGFPVDYHKNFVGQRNDSLYDIVTRAVSTAGGEQLPHLGPALVITPTNQFMKYFQIGIVSPDFGEGVQGIELYVAAPFDKIRANKLLLKNAPLVYGGDAQNEFKAHSLRSGKAYGFNVRMGDEEPVMNLIMPSEHPDHERTLMELLKVAYRGKTDACGDGRREYDGIKHLDAFEWAVNNRFFPEFTSHRDEENLIYFRLFPHTPTGHVYPSLIMKLTVMNEWECGAKPLVKDAFKGIQHLLDAHFTPVEPLFWDVGYSTTAPGADSKGCPPMRGPTNNNNLQLN